MARPIITDSQVELTALHLERKLRAAYGSQFESMTLHVGNFENRVTNKLIVNFIEDGSRKRSIQVWSDGMAGYSKREAYNALRLMAATLALGK